MQDQIENFIQERVYLKSVTPATVQWYRSAFKAFDGAVESLESANTRIVALRQRGLTPTSVNVHVRVLNAFWRWQAKEWKIPRLKEEQKTLATLAPQQVEGIIHWKPTGRNLTRVHTACLTILDTGLRISECLGLARTDLDFENLVIHVKGKGNKQRLVPMSIELRKVLFRYCGKHAHARIFATRNGTRVTTRNFQRDMSVMGRRLRITGVRFSPHTLRHTMAVSYLRHGGDIYSLSRILGHSSVKTTEVYLRSIGIDDLKRNHSRLSLLSRRP
jgi:integrase/recombinase XerD